MAFEQRPNTGALFKNDSTHEKAPQYKGDCLVNGQKMHISAWLNTSAKGVKYMSLKFEPPVDTRRSEPPRRDDPVDAIPDLDDQVPF